MPLRGSPPGFFLNRQTVIFNLRVFFQLFYSSCSRICFSWSSEKSYISRVIQCLQWIKVVEFVLHSVLFHNRSESSDFLFLSWSQVCPFYDSMVLHKKKLGFLTLSEVTRLRLQAFRVLRYLTLCQTVISEKHGGRQSSQCLVQQSFKQNIMRESKLSLFLVNKEGRVRCSGGDSSQLPNRISKGDKKWW